MLGWSSDWLLNYVFIENSCHVANQKTRVVSPMYMLAVIAQSVEGITVVVKTFTYLEKRTILGRALLAGFSFLIYS